MAKVIGFLFGAFQFFVLFDYAHTGFLLATDPDYLPEMEAQMAATIRSYIELETKKLAQLSKTAETLEKRSKEHSEERRNDPISMYVSVTGLVNEWMEIEDVMRNSSYDGALSMAVQVPQSEDVNEILSALFRIQDTYIFNASDIASGSVTGLHHTGGLTTFGCYDIGVKALHQSDYYHSLMWLQEAKLRYHKDPDKAQVSEVEILAPLALSFAEKGNSLHALKEAARLLELLSADSAMKDEIFEKYPALVNWLTEAASSGTGKLMASPVPPPINDRLDGHSVKEQPMYEALCRGEKHQNTTPLTCYFKQTSPYLRLSPAKVEIMSRKPMVLLYRSVISDGEIDTVQSLIRDQMERSKVVDGNSIGIASHARTSSTGWLGDRAHPDVARVRKRVGLVTGLNMETAEGLQVTRYGIGGHYGPHYDHATDEVRQQYGYHGSYDPVHGDRIATFMFYLNEPEAGGGTAFPLGRVAVQPSKNDAVFWFNLKKSGNGDYDTLHAGCPVLSGVKWVANQWIKERGQEFRRPCGLHEDE